MCLCVMHQGAGEGSNFLQSSLDFVPLALCAVCYFTLCQFMGSSVVTLGCSAVLHICVQMLWISISGTLLPGKMTLSCSLVRMILLSALAAFEYPGCSDREHCKVT